MRAQTNEDANYRVEISGWDMGENFFVEQTLLAWCENGNKRVLLRTPLQEGSLVFVRLASALNCNRGIPVMYQVAKGGSRAANGRREFELSQFHPRNEDRIAVAQSELQEFARL